MTRAALLLATATVDSPRKPAGPRHPSRCSTTQTPPPGTPGTGARGASSSRGAGAGGGDAGVHTSYCDNPGDKAARERGYCPGNRNIQEVTGECGLGCITVLDAGGCISDCLLEQTDGAVSANCASCIAATVVCARDNCFNECIGDTQSELCLSCRCGNNLAKHDCYEDYENCAGTHLPECDELEAGTFTGYPKYDAGCVEDAGSGGAGGA